MNIYIRFFRKNYVKNLVSLSGEERLTRFFCVVKVIKETFQWIYFGERRRWFYLPSFNLDMSSTSQKQVDLFDKGVGQLLSNPVLAGGLPANATDYTYQVVCSSGHITVDGIDGSGIQTYIPTTTTTPPAESYVNIIV